MSEDFDTSDTGKDKDDDSFIDYEPAKRFADELLTFLEAPGNKDRIHRLITITQHYYGAFQSAGAGMNDNTRRSATLNLEWAALAMKALIDTGLTDQQLAWEICEWAWPSSGIPPELVSQLLPLMQEGFRILLHRDAPVPTPPDFDSVLVGSVLDDLVIRPAGDNSTGYWGAIGPNGPRFFREVGPDGQPIWPNGKPA